MAKSGLLSAGLLLLGLIGGSPSADAATLTVRPDGQGIFPNLQAAIDAAAPGDTVLALPGTFSGAGNRDLDFEGKDLCLIGRDGSTATTIDCEFLGRGVSLHSGETLVARLIGFTILHGGGVTNAGGIECNGASVTVADLQVRESQLDTSCAGIAIVDGSLHATELIIEDNVVSGSAGCLGFYWADSVLVEDALLEGSSVGGYGGAVEVWESTVTLKNVALYGGEAGISGGAVRSQNSTLTCVGCLFQGNEARDGGALALRGTNLILQNCTFIANYASRWGAALYYDSQGNPSGGLVENCDFRGNNSAYGAIIQLMNQAYPTLRKLTVVGNNHGDGIGAGCCSVQLTVDDCLVAFNHGGYGIADDPSGGSWLWAVCSNIYGNEFGEYENADQTGVNGNISEDPQLCDPSFETLGVADSSPCLPENNACGVLMGNHGAECTLTAVGAPAPSGVALETNYPNPFNPGTTIPFSLSRPAAVTLAIYDLKGRLVAVLAQDRSFPGGRHELRWDGRDAAGQPAPSGVYFYRLDTPAGATARPMLLVK